MSRKLDGGQAGRMECLAALSGGISHELSNIFASVIQIKDLLAPACSDPDSKKLLSMLEDGAQHGLDVLRQLHWLTRGVEGEPVVFQPQYLVAEACKLARATFPRSITVVTDYPRDLWLLRSDPLQFYRLILDLCVLGRDASPETGGTFTLSLRNVHEVKDAPSGCPGILLKLAAEGRLEASPSLRRRIEAQRGVLLEAAGAAPGWLEIGLPAQGSAADLA